MIHLFRNLLAPGGSLPQRDGYHWIASIAWPEIGADAVVAVACYWIAITLVHIARKRGTLPFGGTLLCFAIFFCAFGTMHALEILNAWRPMDWLSGTARAAMALVSATAAILLARLAPKALALPSPTALKWLNAELEQEIANRR
jgi:hypothetical protein